MPMIAESCFPTGGWRSLTGTLDLAVGRGAEAGNRPQSALAHPDNHLSARAYQVRRRNHAATSLSRGNPIGVTVEGLR
jgi:hypothetical protein